MLLLVCWPHTISGGDETNIFLKEGYQNAVFEVAEKTEGGLYGAAGKHKIVDADCYDAFSCSSGDDVVKSFYCPALENFSPIPISAAEIVDNAAATAGAAVDNDALPSAKRRKP